MSTILKDGVLVEVAEVFPAKTALELSAEKRIEINAQRNESLSSSLIVTVEGNDFQADPQSMTQLNDAITIFSAMGGTPAGYMWRDVNNVNHTADLPLLVSIAAARATQVNDIWVNSWNRKAALDAIDLTAVDAIDQINAV